MNKPQSLHACERSETREHLGKLGRILLGVCIGLLILGLLGCSGWFEPGPNGEPPPNNALKVAGEAVGGPVGQIITAVAGLGALVWQTYRAVPAVQRKRHAKYSSTKVKAGSV